MIIDIDAIRQRLFADPAIRARIVRDYGIEGEPSGPSALAAAVIGTFEQQPLPWPIEQTPTNAAVFRAAVRALGSNSRAWATFRRNEHLLTDLLSDYNPDTSARAFRAGALRLEQIKACLPGQSSSADAHAIMRWAQLLADVTDYYGYVQDIGHAFRRLHQDAYASELSNSELLLCLVGYLAYPPTSWAGTKYLSLRTRSLALTRLKAPGMGYALASEFLRNLGWSGFKPDRHIQRLFDRWFGDRIVVECDVRRLQMLIGRKTEELHTYLTYSLVGIAVSPPGMPLSYVDNLVWLLGAYAEKKGRESTTSYLMEARH